MDGYCTCGAQLLPESRFCHKCGKPQYELVAADEEPEAQAPPALPAVAAAAAEPPVAIGFGNPMAVRVAFLAALATFVLFTVPFPPMVQLLWQMVLIVIGGFFAVWLYQRRTGTYLSVRHGARLGWLAGTLCFVMMMVVYTVGLLLITRDRSLRDHLLDALAASGNQQMADQLTGVLDSPATLTFLLILWFVTIFVLFTALAMAGGALGAKVLEKE